MSTRTEEEMIRQALQRQADRALPVDRIKAALPTSTARRTRRSRFRAGAGLAAATVAVGAAVAVPVLGLAPDSRPPTAGRQQAVPPPQAPAAPGQAAPGQAPSAPLPLRFRPTWLPSGFTERSRIVMAGEAPTVVQAWKKSPPTAPMSIGGARLELTVQPAPDDANPVGDVGTEVDVNGRTGRLVGELDGDGKSYLVWMPDNATVLSVQHIGAGVSQAELLRFARSVRPSPAVQEAPLRAGWLPAEMRLSPSVEIMGNWRTSWLATMYVEQPSLAPAPEPSTAEDKSKLERRRGRDPLRVVLTIGTQTEAPAGGERIKVGGRPARFVSRTVPVKETFEQFSVVVELGDRRLLTATTSDASTSRADLLRIAEHVEVGDGPDLSWIGSR